MKKNANIQVSYCVIHAKVREGKKFKAHYLEWGPWWMDEWLSRYTICSI